jgi:hypothetical protein
MKWSVTELNLSTRLEIYLKRTILQKRKIPKMRLRKDFPILVLSTLKRKKQIAP